MMRGASLLPSSLGAQRSVFSCTFRLMPANWPPCSSTVYGRNENPSQQHAVTDGQHQRRADLAMMPIEPASKAPVQLHMQPHNAAYPDRRTFVSMQLRNENSPSSPHKASCTGGVPHLNDPELLSDLVEVSVLRCRTFGCSLASAGRGAFAARVLVLLLLHVQKLRAH